MEDDGGVIQQTAKIMVVAIIVFVIIFYAKRYWYCRRQDDTTSIGRRRLDFAQGKTIWSLGLDPSILKTLAVSVFDPKEFKDGLDCAVCLCEVCEGEEVRILPKCNHGFHVECIDTWFESHSTCPLCRNPFNNDGEEAPSLATNVLFWGDETRVVRPGRVSMIEEEEEVKSPIPSRFRALTRLLSGNSSTRNLDIEQGGSR